MTTRNGGASAVKGVVRPISIPRVSTSQPVGTEKRPEKHSVEPGDVVNGKYRVEKVIGEGGVGIVFAARNIELDERVALKFLKPEMLAQTDIVARFLREAKAACSIKSEYVASVYDVGSLPDGAPFFVMEHLEGEDLGSVVQNRGSLGYRETTEYMMQVCEALAVAHAKGVVHRDIKPENLFLTSRSGMNLVKVLDFGISKAALTGSIFGGAVPLVAKTSNLMGSPLYMSPEQVRSADDVDERTDIWSLGMVLYELLTGTTAFETTNITELCAMILESPMTPITKHRTDLPGGYASIIEKCLEKDPAMRYQNVAELAVALMPFAPRRARICAERATTALSAAGIIEESSVRFTTSIPPPNVSHAPPSYSSLPPDPRTPSLSGEVPVFRPPSVEPASSSVNMAAASSAPSLPSDRLSDTGAIPTATPSHAPTPSVAPAPAQSRKPIPLFLAFAGVALVAAAIAVLVMNKMSAPRASNPSQPVATAAAAAGVTTTTTTTVSSPASSPVTDPPSQSAGTVAAPARAPVAAAPGPAWNPGAPRKPLPAFLAPLANGKTPPATAAPPSAGTPAAKKSADEPDLGY